MTKQDNDRRDEIRLDKWLWAARFFKTRQLAIEAINGGKVHINGQRAKPGKTVRAGTHLTIHKGSLQWQLEVKDVSKQRRPAPEAALLYEETEESRLRRQELVQQRRESGVHPQPTKGKPTKRDRRMIQRFIRGSDS
ncbi:MAG: S4 domain-containing protein [Pseudomonadota bacterium]|nr:S4 domain-containing protein [Pseudomonadota bacterium]